MGLKAKFNLVMLVAFAVGLALAAAFSYGIVQENARQEVLQNARLMMAAANAIGSYTEKEVGPLLDDQSKVRFLPQTIPFWAAKVNLRTLQDSLPDYAYKEAALNPTNPSDRATDWQADIIDTFGRNPGLTELATERNTPTGPTLNMSRPFRITDKDCLTCHSVPSAAPASMTDLYGTANGFGWKLGDTVGAQVVSVPMRVALDKANRTFLVFLGGLAVVFVVMMILLNLLLHYFIIKPVREISRIAGAVSLGNLDVAEYEPKGRDEIASLAASFNRMRRSLANAMKMLENP